MHLFVLLQGMKEEVDSIAIPTLWRVWENAIEAYPWLEGFDWMDLYLSNSADESTGRRLVNDIIWPILDIRLHHPEAVSVMTSIFPESLAQILEGHAGWDLDPYMRVRRRAVSSPDPDGRASQVRFQAGAIVLSIKSHPPGSFETSPDTPGTDPQGTKTVAVTFGHFCEATTSRSPMTLWFDVIQCPSIETLRHNYREYTSTLGTTYIETKLTEPLGRVCYQLGHGRSLWAFRKIRSTPPQQTSSNDKGRIHTTIHIVIRDEHDSELSPWVLSQTNGFAVRCAEQDMGQEDRTIEFGVGVVV
ncbi:hypothetical protein B0H63DRAFT_487262 [Podospora didyma]|uniref:Uncharacterized protein n=1 Tax=Podospora didyma TaxID=330526 RepID=A0AAE0K5L6_9PEZI|nr:hypothetical protein B0H63DRAFT_487262 [Podospora didyma]